MKKIKFRVWDKEKKEMLYGGTSKYFKISLFLSLSLGSLLEAFSDDDGGKSGLWEHEVDVGNGFEIMQFTGLLDKQGKEIYEGDIVRLYRENSLVYRDLAQDATCTIFWNTVGWNPFVDFGFDQANTEIIGNVL